jgi:hypothetical protein
MTPSEFKSSLNALAELLESAGSVSTSAQLSSIATVFNAARDKTAGAALKKLSVVRLGPQGDSDQLRDLYIVLNKTIGFVQKAFPGRSVKLLETFGTILLYNSSASTTRFVEAATRALGIEPKKVANPPREGVVRDYLKRLEAALGDEGFEAIHKHLSEDKGASAAEVIAIAKAFTGKRPTGKSRALQAVWNRHHTLMTFRTKVDARAGRSAA